MTLRVGVIGVGHHGRHHARLLSQSPGVSLVAVVDRDPLAAAAVATAAGTVPLADPKDLLGRVDAVVIAVPTFAHLAVARDFLKQGVATLIEKPLATSAEEAREIVRLADRHGATLQVGHVERFNPAWAAVETAGIRPSFLQSLRYSKFPFRCLDVSVIHDVMIHDLELVLSLVDSGVESVRATGCQILAPTTDRVDAWVRFASGQEAYFSASRLHHESVRLLRLQGENSSVEIDFFRRTSVTTRHHVGRRSSAPNLYAAELAALGRDALEDRYVQRKAVDHDKSVEPLRLEINDFLDSIRSGRRPKVSGEQGLAAVELAGLIHQSLETSRPLGLRKSA